MPELDVRMMERALELAARGRGFVEPNPMVGAVLAREGRIIGEGWHERFGAAHAEMNAIRNASEPVAGATLYVTLEPCCHVGKTPPCTDAVIAAGITRVVAAMHDPFPQVAGEGEAQLRRHGVQVEIGLCEAAARALNAPYLKLVETGRPYVIAKWAMSLDGKIATRTGDSMWISNELSRQRVHELRGRVDGIVIGSGTALRDDPLLTARPPGPRTATRVVLDSQLRLPFQCQLVQTAKQFPTLIAHAADAPADRRAALVDAGCECIAIQRGADGLDIAALQSELGRRRFTNVLVEGGSAVHAAFITAGEVDEVWAFVAPKLFGGNSAPTPIGGLGVAHVAGCPELTSVQIESLGTDVLIRGRLKATAASETQSPP